MSFRLRHDTLTVGGIWGLAVLVVAAGCSGAPDKLPDWTDQSPVARLMEVLDRDGEPGLSREEIEAASDPKVVFADHDTSGDGVLDEAEVRVLLSEVSPLGRPRPFFRDPRVQLPLKGMQAFQGSAEEACERFESFVDDALFHVRLVGGQPGALKEDLKNAILAGDCSIHGTESAAVLAELARLWRTSHLMDIFREMGVD